MTEEQVKSIVLQNKGMGGVGVIVVFLLVMVNCSQSDKLKDLERRVEVLETNR